MSTMRILGSYPLDTETLSLELVFFFVDAGHCLEKEVVEVCFSIVSAPLCVMLKRSFCELANRKIAIVVTVAPINPAMSFLDPLDSFVRMFPLFFD
jgi:hypothetical protein